MRLGKGISCVLPENCSEAVPAAVLGRRMSGRGVTGKEQRNQEAGWWDSWEDQSFPGDFKKHKTVSVTWPRLPPLPVCGDRSGWGCQEGDRGVIPVLHWPCLLPISVSTSSVQILSDLISRHLQPMWQGRHCVTYLRVKAFYSAPVTELLPFEIIQTRKTTTVPACFTYNFIVLKL